MLITQSFETYSSLGQYVRLYRRLLDLSQQDIANALQMRTSGKNTISNIENERIVPNFLTAVKIINFLHAKGAPTINLQAIAKREEMNSRPLYEEDADEKETIEHDDFVAMRE